MRELFFILGSEKRMIRDFAIMGLAIVGLALIGMHGVKAAAGLLSAQQIPVSAQSTPKVYTITRSVLDDNPATGSIKALNEVRLAPCGR